MFGLGHWEVVIVVFAIVLLFGGKKIPEIAKGLGKGIREFKDAQSGKSEKLEEGKKDSSQKTGSEENKDSEKT